MYLGAYFALKDSLNPERFALAAHDIRELMEKVPEIVAESESPRTTIVSIQLERTHRNFQPVISPVIPQTWGQEPNVALITCCPLELKLRTIHVGP